MENKVGIIILRTTKDKCLSAKQISDLYIIIDSIKSVLIKYHYAQEHPFYSHLIKVEEYFKHYENSVFGIGIATAQKMINDIIDSIIVELQVS